MSRHPNSFSEWLARMPLVAILRGVEPQRAAEYAFVLAEEGFAIIEVPLNGERALEAIGALAGAMGRYVLVGAGTVLNESEVARAHEAGAQLIVSPDTNPAVIAATKARRLYSLPGIYTPSDAIGAISAGADALKLFPAETASPATLAAFRSILGPRMAVLPVGGITPETMEAWWRVGAAGFGIGSALFRPGFSLDEVRRRAAAFAAVGRKLLAERGE